MPETDPLEALHRYTLLESPTGDRGALDALAETLEADAVAAGFTTTRDRHPTGDHLIWDLEGRGNGKLLLLTHYDTVWPIGTLGTMPWSIDGDTLRGPGVYDTKSGIAALFTAINTLKDRLTYDVRVIAVADEEIGSPTAGDLVRAEAAEAIAVLGMEPPHPGGDLKTGRRGSTRARIEVTGIESHAALDPDAGVNAIDELIDQLIRVRTLAEGHPVLLNTGTIRGGGRTNVVAGQAHADLGLRFEDAPTEDFILSALGDLSPVRSGAKIATRLLSHRPTWQPATEHPLLDKIKAVARQNGQTIDGRPADGAADTNTTGALGVPTLDGLAPPGGGAHARTEWVSIKGITDRVALLRALLTADLTSNPPEARPN